MKATHEVVNLERIEDGQPFQKSIQNWNALPKAQKDKYRVIGGTTAAGNANVEANKNTSVEIPQEVKNLRKSKSQVVEVKAEETPVAAEVTEQQVAPEVNNEGDATVDAAGNANVEGDNVANADDALTNKILARYDELEGTFEERRKVLSNEFSLHWRKVDTILKNADKK